MIRTSVPRIRSVRLKKTGAKLYIFDNPCVRETHAAFERAVDDVQQQRKTDMVGYAIVAWGVDGGVSTGATVRDGRWVGRAELPNFVKTELQSFLTDSMR